MADYHKVHPIPANPTAPPYSRSSSMGTHSTASSVAIQMPDEKEMKKEEERRLMQQEEAQQKEAQQKDFIYKMPAPLPPDHPSLRGRAARAAGGRRRGCGRSCCCCMGVFCAIVAGIIVTLGITALVLYIVLQPKTPDFSVTDATIASFNLSAEPVSAEKARAGVSVYLNADVTFDVEAENPNKKIGIYYDAVEVTLFYEDEQIGTGSIPAFYQGHKNTSLLLLHMKGEDVGLTPSIGSALQTTLNNVDASVFLHAKTLAQVRIKIGSWKSRSSKFQIDCDVEMSNPTSPNPHLLSKSCSFKVKKLML